MKHLVKQALWDTSPTLFNLLTRRRNGQTFSIGIYTGTSLSGLANPSFVTNPVLTHTQVVDMPAAFVADPFMIRHDSMWYLFFEAFNRASGRGEICVATSSCGLEWTYAQRVLAEPFHLAYPHVFECDGRFYMVPDTPDQGVLLYEAVDFPLVWKRADVLIDGTRFSDSTVFQFDGRWWMLTAWSVGHSDLKSLRLYHADAPHGPWHEHPMSPIRSADQCLIRPAGRVVIEGGHPIRFAQDGVPAYGSRVHAFEVTELSRTTYQEQPLQSTGPILGAGPESWHAGGMHHLDAHKIGEGVWIACVDGWYSC